jgi:hypothetical protein
MSRHVYDIRCIYNALHNIRTIPVQDRVLKHFIPPPSVFGKHGAGNLLLQFEKHHLAYR